MLQFPIIEHQMPKHQTKKTIKKNNTKKKKNDTNLTYSKIKHTLVENLLYAKPSGAVHFIGNLAPAWAVYVSSLINRAKPKSATLTR